MVNVSAVPSFRDQEGLNAVPKSAFAPIPWQWNTITLIGRDRIPRPSGMNIPKQAKVLHHVEPLKPRTDGGSQIPCADYFFESLGAQNSTDDREEANDEGSNHG